MWQPLLKMLEGIGRIRVPLWKSRIALNAGNPDAPDALGDIRWKRYRSAEMLFDAWGPVGGSLWEPFHCVTLFAALERFRAGAIGPTDTTAAAEIDAAVGNGSMAEGVVPGWAGPGVFAAIDLPGPQSVALGARLVRAGMQPVCTFDNWPHAAGLLKPERILAQLLRFAPVVDSSRHALTPASPPVWLCDRDRLGLRPGRPREFDNRYYLDDSLLPGMEMLRKAGIGTVLCVLPAAGAVLLDDLRHYFAALQKNGFETVSTNLSEPDLRLWPLELRPQKTPRFRNYQRSSAGGFGVLVPEPSSGSGG